MKRKRWIPLVLLGFVFVGLGSTYFYRKRNPTPPKLYWFIPDGFRADRGQFNIFEWARSGELPNLAKMMENGCYGYSWPVFPGHTPVNFATLMTGVLPEVHGVADGSMRLQNYPLNTVVKGGFSSFAKLVAPIWVQLEDHGSLVSLQSVPGSTPPELFRGNTIKGRWGGWGVDFPSMVFQDNKTPQLSVDMGRNKRVFGMGTNLTRFVEPSPSQNGPVWDLKNWGYDLFASIASPPRANEQQPPHVVFSHDGKNPIADLQVGQWSEWLPFKGRYELKNGAAPIDVDTQMKIKPIRATASGDFRVRVLYDGLNETLTSPSELAAKMRDRVGPMVDFVDNYPPQLIYFQEDKQTFLEEAKMSWNWHQRAVPFLVNDLKSDVVIHSIYSPNQMLTSRWWMPYVDKDSRLYGGVTEPQRTQLWSEVKQMYKEADALLGEVLKSTDDSWYIILSSDHGALPLYREVRLNNLFAKRGWLKYRFNKEHAEYEVDWEHTQVVYLQMNNVYINPSGLAGPYTRASSPAYFKLRAEVENTLRGLKDEETGVSIADHIWTHEEAKQAGLPEDRVGDLILANAHQYNWSEDISPKQEIFVPTLKGGYKQGVWPKSAEGMLTPFVIMGPGIKKGCKLPNPIEHVDQYATIAHLFHMKPPYQVAGRVLEEVLEK